MMSKIICLNCNKVFESQRKDAKYCNNACRQEHYRHEKDKRDKQAQKEKLERKKKEDVKAWFRQVPREEKKEYLKQWITDNQKDVCKQYNFIEPDITKIYRYIKELLGDSFDLSRHHDATWEWAKSICEEWKNENPFNQRQKIQREKEEKDLEDLLRRAQEAQEAFKAGFQTNRGGVTSMLQISQSPMLQEVIKAGYKTLSKKYHPDSGGDAEKMKELNNIKDQFNL